MYLPHTKTDFLTNVLGKKLVKVVPTAVSSFLLKDGLEGRGEVSSSMHLLVRKGGMEIE